MTCKKRTKGLAALGILATSIVAAAQDLPTAAYTMDLEIGATLSMPSDVDIGKDGKMYAVDGGNHQVAVFDAAGLRIATLGNFGSEDGLFDSPVGIGINGKGEVYIADKGNRRLQMFSADGEFRRSIALEEEGDAIDPIDVAVSANGKELFVTTNNTHRVVVFSNKGKFLRAWGGEGEDDGQFIYPATIDIDSAGNVYVVDVINARVQKFDSAGTHLLTIGERGGKAGTFFRPKGVAVDDAGNIYVSDSFLGVVQVFGPDGEFAYVIGEDGTATVYDTPVGLAASGSRLYVTQMLAGKVAVLEPQAPPPPAPEEEAAE